MPAAEINRSLEAHKRWLGYLQPDGLVVSAAALVDRGHYYNEAQRQRQIEFLDHITVFQTYDAENDAVEISDFRTLAVEFLRWPAQEWVDAADLPNEYHVYLKESSEVLSPLAALRLPRSQRETLAEDQSPFQLLIFESGHSDGDFDKPYEVIQNTWLTSATRRCERLLRETGVPTGLLLSKTALRLVYAPQGENPGHLTFRYSDMVSTMGRPILGAFELLLGRSMLFMGDAKDQLPALLRHSRSMQASVSATLAEQVLEALYELVRGFQSADARVHGDLLRNLMAKDPDEVYHGQLTVLLRLVFLLFAEDRGLLPASPLFIQHYSLHALFDRLSRDAALHHEGMDQRFGAWPQLLTLFRLVHGGHRHRDLEMPAREGHLFDPDRFPFLEGRSVLSDKYRDSDNQLPTVSDGVIHRILEKLLILRGERLSYRTLDVEQIGSVYQTMIGFTLELAKANSIALKAAKSNGAPAFVNLDELLATSPSKRVELLQKNSDHRLTGKIATAVKDATSHEDLLAALERKISRQASPEKLPAGSYLLQPTNERRRSGSHYTPRALTAPIVKKTLEPILTRFGEKPTPHQILDLKICDPAVGSGAFLVEACRQLGDALVAAWTAHGGKPVIPPDEDELLHARRLVAQRCLYGVDRNPMATDLAKLSLWLATLAKDHPFTFLDHSLRSGDALVGLSKRQIVAFHWDLDAREAKERVFGQTELEKALERAISYRREILEGGDYMLPGLKSQRLALADHALDPVRRAGDLCLASFFAENKPKKRAERREEYLSALLECDPKHGFRPERIETVEKVVDRLKRGTPHPIMPFHWEIEFPEVFSRSNSGFDAFVGNPPYAGKNTVIQGNRENYLDWLLQTHEESHGNADLVAHFFRRAFNLLRSNGTSGFIATNTIGQGDTRHTGLRWICSNGGLIYAANRRQKWPGEAAVVVSVVWITKAKQTASFELDGNSVPIITAFLFHDGGHESPASLRENAGRSFVGSYVLGMGFTFDDTDKKGVASSIGEMKRLIAQNPRNADRIFPYIGGEEVNDSPTHTHHRYVINFLDFPLRRETGLRQGWCRADEDQRAAWLRAGVVPDDYPDPVAADWPDLLGIVEQKVKPNRMTQGSIVNPDRWYRFARPASDFVAAVANLKLTRVLATCRHQPNWGVTFMSANSVFAESLVLIGVESYALFGVFQSNVHEIWARFCGSSMKDDLRYNPTDCFETFPFPLGWESSEFLDKIGEQYYRFRADLMVCSQEGLTKTYNRFHDSEESDRSIFHLRELHATLDHAVLSAYGWGDLVEKGCACYEFLPDYYDEPEEEGGDPIPQSIRYRWPDSVRDEVLARLLKLNAERHVQEVAQGLQSVPARKAAKKIVTKIAAKKTGSLRADRSGRMGQASLQFGDNELGLFKAAPAPTEVRQPPVATRVINEDPNINGTALVAALLHEAQGPLSWSRLRDAFILATSPRLMSSHALPEDKELVRNWEVSWLKSAGPENLLQAILNLGDKNLATGRNLAGEPTFQLLDGFVGNIEEHASYDAWLSLRILQPYTEDLTLDLGDVDMSEINAKALEFAT